MNHKLFGFLNIIGVLILLAWAPGALAASWSTNVCPWGPTYGPYCCTKYYCPAVGSFDPTTFLTGQIASDINQCDPNKDPENCVKVSDEITLDTEGNAPNQLFQCGVPGATTCKNPGKCGGSSDSSGIVFVKQSYQASLTAELTTQDSCTKDGRDKQIKCTKSQRFAGYEGDPAKAAEVCQNDKWQILKWLALRLKASNWLVYGSDPAQVYRTDLRCVLVDPKGKTPGETGYSPDLTTLSNNHYDCEELPQPSSSQLPFQQP